ncbi:MAG: hypothetical protein JXX14_15860 [Deltaproteobacteria bacterium]|nr:hypothetical protein [Deltaproteobacteria bacterium]
MFNVAICLIVTLFIALPTEAKNRTRPHKNEKQLSNQEPSSSNESPEMPDAFEKSRYFRFGLSGAFGRYRYTEDWTYSDKPAILRYQGPGMEFELELGRQWKSGVAFGAALQLGLLPRLNQFWQTEEYVHMESETANLKFIIAGFVFLHHPFGIKNGYYIAIRPGISLMLGVPNYLPYLLPGFSIAMGYDFLERAKDHLGVEAKMTTVLGKGGDETDYNDMDMRARLISFSLAFTVAFY